MIYILSISNHNHEETKELQHHQNSSHSSGITALLDKNLLISSNEALQEIPGRNGG